MDFRGESLKKQCILNCLLVQGRKIRTKKTRFIFVLERSLGHQHQSQHGTDRTTLEEQLIVLITRKTKVIYKKINIDH